MEILTIAIGAGESKHFHKAGKYFEVMTAEASFEVEWYDAQGTRSRGGVGMVAGVYTAHDFRGFEVSSAAAQTIRLLISDQPAGYRAGAYFSPVLIAQDGVAQVAAGTAAGGWVSGRYEGLAAGVPLSVLFDLGEAWAMRPILTVNITAVNAPLNFLRVYCSDVPLVNERMVNYAYSTGFDIVYSSRGSNGQWEFHARPTGRYARVYAENPNASAAGVGSRVFICARPS